MRRLVFVLLFAASGSGALAAAPDGVGLSISKTEDPDDLVLEWDGGQPTFEVFRSERAHDVTESYNKLGETVDRTWRDTPPHGEIVFYRIVSPCVVDPPERCDGIDNDCDGTIDGPGSEASCDLANATPACESGVCVVLTCDPGFDDCDGQDPTGCEIDLDSDPANCGNCNDACAVPNATAGCASGTCVVNACDPGFDDCNLDAVDGCETDLATTSDCGACGNACSLPNSTPACVSGACAVGVCDPGFDDCDLDPATGCEADLGSDLAHCGACGNACVLPNAVASCSGGTCTVESCVEGAWDVNGLAADGCEYLCTFESGLDLPDDAFVDANCDGIDGDAAGAIFVATDGSDAAPGTRDQPKRTIQAAIDAAYVAGKDVYVSSATYGSGSTLTLRSGVSLFGGYDRAAGWSRSDADVATLSGPATAVAGTSVSSITIDHLTIRAASATATGASSYGIRLSSPSNVTVRRSTVVAGDGVAGSPGSSGASGSHAVAGNHGVAGCEDSTVLCSSCSAPLGGAGGGGCSTGGAGGRGGHGTGSGYAGSSGSTGAAGGSGGSCDRNFNGSCGTVGACYCGQDGQDGQDGVAGTNGAGGSSFNGASASSYTNAHGGSGSGGARGGGGGGGGGGHGGDDGCDSYGSSGGGGGGGGCPGASGTGGGGGGGSFAVWIDQGSGIRFEFSGFETGRGGAGGAGGLGGAGGAGGAGGSGWIYGGSGEQDDGGCGGDGGRGGQGGRGGHGGGGGGGPSIGIVVRQSSYNSTGNTFLLGGGGAGGPSNGNAGSSGLTKNVHIY